MSKFLAELWMLARNSFWDSWELFAKWFCANCSQVERKFVMVSASVLIFVLSLRRVMYLCTKELGNVDRSLWKCLSISLMFWRCFSISLLFFSMLAVAKAWTKKKKERERVTSGGWWLSLTFWRPWFSFQVKGIIETFYWWCQVRYLLLERGGLVLDVLLFFILHSPFFLFWSRYLITRWEFWIISYFF